MCFKCQKYGHERERAAEDIWHLKSVAKRDPDHMEDDCPNKNKHP